MPSSSAKRVAMCRILTALVPAGLLPAAGRFPESQCAQDVPAFFALDVEPLADGPGTHRPGEKDRGRIVCKGAVEIRHGHTIRRIGFRRTHGVEGLVHGAVPVGAWIPRHIAMP